MVTEKEAIELETAKHFIEIYNSQMGNSFRIVEHTDSPDFHCKDKEGNEFNIEITLTEDRNGDIKSILGRSEARSPEELKRHREAVRRGEENNFDRISCLGGNVSQMAQNRIQPKLYKDYGPNTALVVRDISGVGWNWEDAIEDLEKSLDLTNNPFDKGIWLISLSSNQIYQVV